MVIGWQLSELVRICLQTEECEGYVFLMPETLKANSWGKEYVVLRAV